MSTVQTTTSAKVRVLPSLDESLAQARVLQPERYESVVRVTAQTTDGRPARVVIVCECGTERECAVQDLFQVRRCVPCQDAAVRAARSGRAKRRTQTLKQRIAELEAQIAAQTNATE